MNFKSRIKKIEDEMDKRNEVVPAMALLKGHTDEEVYQKYEEYLAKGGNPNMPFLVLTKRN